MNAILKNQPRDMNLPAPTRDVEQGKRDMDEYGLCVHEAFVSGDQLKALKDRLIEQAELECEQGVALLSGQSRGARLKPPGRQRAGQRRRVAAHNRVFIDYLQHRC
jgi:hypothetical protein